MGEDPCIRGRLIAHQIEAALREAYEADAQSEASRKPSRDSSGPTLEDLERSVFANWNNPAPG